MVVAENASLENLNTFRIKARTRFLVEVTGIHGIDSFIRSDLNRGYARMILGGGSNILFTQNYDGCILRPLIRGVDKIAEDSHSVTLKAGAGENWDELVQYCVGKGYGGIENLSYIPGTVGAAPIQNIGAYGVEVRSVVESVDTINLDNGRRMQYSNRQCRFSYRNSLFKTTLKDRIVITHVTLVLHKDPKFVLSYGGLEKEVGRYPGINLNTIRASVIAIRKAKLPDPEIIANAGSFFKNPEVDAKKLDSLRSMFKEIPHYESGEGKYKIPAAWLIDKCGWKGRREGNTGTYEKQPLVVVNYGQSSGIEILAFSEKVRQAVINQFDIPLETEVNVV